MNPSSRETQNFLSVQFNINGPILNRPLKAGLHVERDLDKAIARKDPTRTRLADCDYSVLVISGFVADIVGEGHAYFSHRENDKHDGDQDQAIGRAFAG